MFFLSILFVILLVKWVLFSIIGIIVWFLLVNVKFVFFICVWKWLVLCYRLVWSLLFFFIILNILSDVEMIGGVIEFEKR